MQTDNPGDPPPTQSLVVRSRDIEWLTVHSWARNGAMQSAWPHDGKDIPEDATEIGVRLVNFPIGSVRHITLKTGARTHPHGSAEDVLFYQVTGRRVQMCEDESGTKSPGDVSFEPHGVEHSTYQLIGGLFVEFALPAPHRPGGRPVWLKASEAREIPCATWTGQTGLEWADGPEAHWAPASATRHLRRVFSFPGHDLIETVLHKGARTRPRCDVHDTLFYVVRGQLLWSVGETIEVEEGDSLRAPAGQEYELEAITDAMVIQAAARSFE
jgi:quercetin dioxygenase-like cupin family protein